MADFLFVAAQLTNSGQVDNASSTLSSLLRDSRIRSLAEETFALSLASALAGAKDLDRPGEPRTKGTRGLPILIASNDGVICWAATPGSQTVKSGVEYAEQTATRRYDPKLDGQVGCICR